jgi:hypothetical protein
MKKTPPAKKNPAAPKRMPAKAESKPAKKAKSKKAVA